MGYCGIFLQNTWNVSGTQKVMWTGTHSIIVGGLFNLVCIVRLKYFENRYECFSTLWIIHLIVGMSSDARISFLF